VCVSALQREHEHIQRGRKYAERECAEQWPSIYREKSSQQAGEQKSSRDLYETYRVDPENLVHPEAVREGRETKQHSRECVIED